MSPSDEGFRDLYEREFGAVVRAAYLVSGDRDVAQEAAQEAFARPSLAGAACARNHGRQAG
jgi:DNA-directed RNA polymerase specialized sigma24 family protein